MINKNEVIAVLLGGLSHEAEISRRTGAAVTEALCSLGYKAIPVEYKPDSVLEQLQAINAKMVFIALHGKYGEDGTIQSILELAGIPYTGSGVSSSAITMDKILSSRIFKQAGINMAFSMPYYLLDGLDKVEDSIKKHFKFPVVLKPACEGSTIGIEIVQKPGDLRDALSRAFLVESRLLVETFLDLSLIHI